MDDQIKHAESILNAANVNGKHFVDVDLGVIINRLMWGLNLNESQTRQLLKNRLGAQINTIAVNTINRKIEYYKTHSPKDGLISGYLIGKKYDVCESPRDKNAPEIQPEQAEIAVQDEPETPEKERVIPTGETYLKRLYKDKPAALFVLHALVHLGNGKRSFETSRKAISAITGIHRLNTITESLRLLDGLKIIEKTSQTRRNSGGMLYRRIRIRFIHRDTANVSYMITKVY